MYPRLFPISPSQASVNGAMDIFVEGHRRHKTPQMLVGLSVLSSATEAQVGAAMLFAGARHHVSIAEIRGMLAE